MNVRYFVTGAAGSILIVMGGACSVEPTGLDSSQLERRWSSTSTSIWSEVPVVSTTSPASAHDEVSEAFDDLVAYRAQCGRDPSSCDVPLLAVEGSEFAADLEELLRDRVANGITASDNGRAEYRIEEVEILSSNRASVTTCLVDDTVLVIESAVFDDSVYSARSVWTLQHTEDGWRLSDERIIEWIMEGSLCDEL